MLHSSNFMDCLKEDSAAADLALVARFLSPMRMCLLIPRLLRLLREPIMRQ